MDSTLLGLIELLLVFGLVMWFGVSQLRALRRGDDTDGPRGDARDSSVQTRRGPASEDERRADDDPR